MTSRRWYLAEQKQAVETETNARLQYHDIDDYSVESKRYYHLTLYGHIKTADHYTAIR